MLNKSASSAFHTHEAYLVQAFQVSSFKFSEDGPDNLKLETSNSTPEEQRFTND
jgi:hypothetical protein